MDQEERTLLDRVVVTGQARQQVDPSVFMGQIGR